MSPPPSLSGKVIALSMSPPNDLIRLGYPMSEFDRLVFELALHIVRAGGKVLYGGHLRDGSLTVAMFEHIAGAYGTLPEADDGERPFLHFLPFNEFRDTPFPRLVELLARFRSFVETRVILPGDGSFRPRVKRLLDDAVEGGQGLEIRPIARPRDALLITGQSGLAGFAGLQEAASDADYLSLMRQAQAAVDGRIVLGGKRGDGGVADDADRYSGAMPGICEEVNATIERGSPVAVLAAFGGAGRDVAVELGVLEEDERTPFLGGKQDGVEGAWQMIRDKAGALDSSARTAMSAFAHRDDSEMLARDVVRWLARSLAPDPAAAARPSG